MDFLMTQIKKCKGCKESLPIDNFAIATKDGYRRGDSELQCRACPHGKTTANVGSTTVDDCI